MTRASRWSAFLAIALLACTPSASAPASGNSTITAKELLARVAAKYAACTSYRDSGSIRGFDPNGKWHFGRGGRFTTAFARPNRLRIELEQRCVVWSSGTEAASWQVGEKSPARATSVEVPLRDAFRDDDVAATLVVPLLLPGVFPERALPVLPIVSEPILDERTDTPCWRLDLRLDDYPLRLWIERDGLTLRRAEVPFSSPGNEGCVHVVRWTPEFDVPIEEAALALSAPPEEGPFAGTFEWVRCIALVLLVYGVAQIWLGRHALALRRPFILPTWWYALPAALAGTIEPLLQLSASATFVLQDLEDLLNDRNSFTVLLSFLLVIGFPLLVVVSHTGFLRGWTLFGITELPLRRALKLVLDTAQIPYEFKKRVIVLKEGAGSITMTVDEKRRVAGLVAKGRAGRRVLRQLLPLIEPCLRVEAVALDPARCRAYIRRGSIVSAIAIALAVATWIF